MGVEYATGNGKPGGTFAGLALQSGFSEAECAMAARNNMLIGIVRVAELRGRRERDQAGGLSGAAALAKLQQMQGRLLDARLREAGLI
jgi:hypothetical protein